MSVWDILSIDLEAHPVTRRFARSGFTIKPEACRPDRVGLFNPTTGQSLRVRLSNGEIRNV